MTCEDDSMQTQALTPELSNGHAKLARAVSLACSYHVAQVRKGTDPPIPYVSHLLQVAGLVLEYGGDLDQAAAGVLHDALEDTHADPPDIIIACGGRVGAIIVECTDTNDDGGGDPSAKAPWVTRKARHLEHLKAISRDAALVIACDKLHNIRTQVADLRHTRKTVEFNAPFEARKAVQVAAIASLHRKIPARLYADLCDAHEEWETLHGETQETA